MNSNRTLTNDEIQRYAPSAFAGQPYEKTSDRYAFIPTSNVIDAMRNAGFLPVMAAQSRTRIPGKQNFTKHMIRFRQMGQQLINVGDSVLETILVNSHDGSSRYILSMGVHRLVCSNGMTVSDGTVESIKVRHTGNIVQQVVDASAKLMEYAGKVSQTISRWREIQLTDEEMLLLATAAHRLRFTDSDMAAAIQPEMLLSSRRTDDNGTDLWTVFNRIQENVVRGGLRGRTQGRNVETTNGFRWQRGRRFRTREVNGIDQNLRLNRDLWAAAEALASTK